MGSSIVTAAVSMVTAADEGASELREIELPVDPIWYGVITLGMFLLLLGITYSFKNVAARR